eukprot:TRINITY_DN8730_c0_g1_i1.p1 TRINITY_DN8730_c0_g1~~TRINITY_DN8730_c0_g1_i1.p1  ORF type:complete len:301 (+),score=3.85 TRINITY_DN8730_c0_g1_i1:40-942(+)
MNTTLGATASDEFSNKEWVYYKITHYVLAGIYGLVFFFCAVGLFRKVVRYSQYEDSTERTANRVWQIIFYPFIILGCAGRITYLIFSTLLLRTFCDHFSIIFLILATLASFLFFSAYLLIICQWAQTYHAETFSKMLKVFTVVNVVLYSSLVVVYILDFYFYAEYCFNKTVPVSHNLMETATFVYDGSLYILSSFGFIVYAVLLYKKMKRRVRSSTRHIIVFKLKFLAIVLVCAFCVRSIIVVYFAFPNHAHLMKKWWFDLFFFFSLEIVPLVLMLLILQINTRPRDGDNAPLIVNHVIY